MQGMDISDISLVIQWRATCKISALWQRFGRAARDKLLSGTAILFAEKKYFSDEQEAMAMRRERRKKIGSKRAPNDACLPASSRPKKRRAVDVCNQPVPYSSSAFAPSHHLSSIPNAPSGHRVQSSTPETSSSNPIHRESVDQAGGDGGLSESESDSENILAEMGNAPMDERTTVTGLGTTSSGVEMLMEALKKNTQCTVVKGHARKRRELDPPVDCLINADKHPDLMCRRKIFDICFDENAPGGKFSPVSPYILTLLKQPLTISSVISTHAAPGARSQCQQFAATFTTPLLFL